MLRAPEETPEAINGNIDVECVTVFSAAGAVCEVFFFYKQETPLELKACR